MKFAKLLARARREKGLSQYALAKAAGVSGQALSLLELGQREPSWETVQRLARALKVSADVFMDADIKLPVVKPARMGRPPKARAAAEEKERPAKTRSEEIAESYEQEAETLKKIVEGNAERARQADLASRRNAPPPPKPLEVFKKQYDTLTDEERAAAALYVSTKRRAKGKK
jgi:transcriptional regulator with XRE-family HTH domain